MHSDRVAFGCQGGGGGHVSMEGPWKFNSMVGVDGRGGGASWRHVEVCIIQVKSSHNAFIKTVVQFSA